MFGLGLPEIIGVLIVVIIFFATEERILFLARFFGRLIGRLDLLKRTENKQTKSPEEWGKVKINKRQ